MATAKEIIRIGNTVVALPGGYVSNAQVKEMGWEKLVDASPDPKNTAEVDEKAPKGPAQKGK